jgi:hypothetical protein
VLPRGGVCRCKFPQQSITAIVGNLRTNAFEAFQKFSSSVVICSGRIVGFIQRILELSLFFKSNFAVFRCNKIWLSIRPQIASSHLSKGIGNSTKAVGGQVGEPRDEVEVNPESQASAGKIGLCELWNLF